MTPTVPPPRAPYVFVPAIVSGLLLWAAFYPLNLGFLAYFALVPWLLLVRAPGVARRRRYLAAFVGGLAFFLPATQWIRVAHPAMYASWLGMSLICASYFPLMLAVLRALDRLGKPPLAFTVPIVWVAFEYIRAHFPTGFPILIPLHLHQYVGFAWYFLGHTQHDYLPLLQVADLGGVYLVSLVVAVVNGALHEWLMRSMLVQKLVGWPTVYRPGYFREMWVGSVAILSFTLAFTYGMSRLQHPEFKLGPRVAAIQADIPQDTKMGDTKKLFADYNELCEQVAARADLVIWPETCYPVGYQDFSPTASRENLPKEIRDGLEDNALLERHANTRWRTNVLLGTSVYEWDGTRNWQFNSAVLVGSDGTFADRYDKMHLIPFGEYVPFRETFPWLKNFTPYKNDYSCRPGERRTRFAFNVGDVQYTFGCLICYEDSDPLFARTYNRPSGNDRPVDFLVNISNDGWFRGTEEHEQHLAICRFRAVEARRSIVRAVNMGVSAIIDSDGRIQALPGDTRAESVQLRGTVTDKIRLDTRTSFYAQTGDWLPAVCIVLMLVGLVASFRARL